MKRRIKEFIEIEEHDSLDELIAKLVEIRDTSRQDCRGRAKAEGRRVFGRKITVSYFRDQTGKRRRFEERYAAAYKEAPEKELARLQQELGVVCYPPGKARKLRIVA